MTKILQQLQNRKPGFASHIEDGCTNHRVSLSSQLYVSSSSAQMDCPTALDGRMHRSFRMAASGSSIPKPLPRRFLLFQSQEISENEVRSIEFIPNSTQAPATVSSGGKSDRTLVESLGSREDGAPSLPEWNFEIREVNGMLDRLEKIP